MKLLSTNFSVKKVKTKSYWWKPNVLEEYEQNVVARSSAKVALALTTCELMWLKQLIKELKLCELGKIESIYNNLAALHIAFILIVVL